MDILSDLTQMSGEDILLLRAAIRGEMKRRGIADSVGAVGEQLAIEHFRKTSGLPKLQLAPRGTKNVDALSRNGDRFSIKTVCDGSKTGTIYPDSEDKEKQLFEHILIVRLADDWSLKAIYQFSWKEFVSVRSWDRRMNAWYIGCSTSTLCKAQKVFDATPKTSPSD